MENFVHVDFVQMRVHVDENASDFRSNDNYGLQIIICNNTVQPTS